VRINTRQIYLWLAAVIVAVALGMSCTLDIQTPDDPPPDSWDPALNTHPDGSSFQRLLDEYVRRGLPGVVLFVNTPDGVWNGASGYANIETGRAMTPAHRHWAASVTKMYIASAGMLLAEDGDIDLDKTIDHYLPASVYGDVPNAAGSTVRHVLGHTSGIPDFGVLAYDLDTFNDPMGSFPPERLLSYVKGETPIFSPGNGYMYSNTNYLLLALLLDHVTGASHADVISDRILQPLALDATYYKNEPGYPTPPGLVNSYHDLAGDGRLANVTDLAIHYNGMYVGHTGVIATSADYAAFIEALLGGDLIGPEMLDEMLAHTECDCYGLGLGFVDTPYGTGIGHGGGDLGILSQVRHFPDLDATLVLLINGGDDGVTEDLFQQLWDNVMRAALGGL
jgi:D-alanyl-D-alanine carboxypeptidase